MRVGGIDMGDNTGNPMKTELFIPKGSMCAVCAKQAATTNAENWILAKCPY